MPAASGCTTSKLRSSLGIFRIISRRCWRFISPHLLGLGRTMAFCLLFLPFWDFCDASLRCAPGVEFNLARPGRRNLHNLPSGVRALLLIQDKPATIFTIAKTGAMLLIGQIRSRETTAITVAPSCVSDCKVQLNNTGKACRRTLDEFQGHTIPRQGWPALLMYIDSRYPIRHTLPPGGSGERARDYIKQGLGLSTLPQGERQRTIYSLYHARSGLDSCTVSASPLCAQSRRSEPSWIMAQLWKIFIRFRGPRPYDDSCEIGLTVSVDFDSVVYQKFARTFTVSLQLPGLESRSDLVGCGTCFQIPRKTE